MYEMSIWAHSKINSEFHLAHLLQLSCFKHTFSSFHSPTLNTATKTNLQNIETVNQAKAEQHDTQIDEKVREGDWKPHCL